MTFAEHARRIPALAAAESAVMGRMTHERDLPIADYDNQNVESIVARLPNVTQPELRRIAAYERAHKDRAGVRAAVEHAASSKLAS